MRASGGKPVQLTHGPGARHGSARIVRRTLLYLNRLPLVRLSWWNVETGARGMITREDQPFKDARPSPTGGNSNVNDPDVISADVSVMIMNRDGSGHRVVVPASEAAQGTRGLRIVAGSQGRPLVARAATQPSSTWALRHFCRSRLPDVPGRPNNRVD